MFFFASNHWICQIHFTLAVFYLLTHFTFTAQSLWKESRIIYKREYNINGTWIVSIDHGYGNIKTAHTCFKASILSHECLPTFTANLLEYKGRYYTFGTEHKPFIPDKIMDEDYYILTLMALRWEANSSRNIQPPSKKGIWRAKHQISPKPSNPLHYCYQALRCRSATQSVKYPSRSQWYQNHLSLYQATDRRREYEDD